MALTAHFATSIYEATLADDRGFAAFNTELEGACRMIATEDAAGRGWSRRHGYAGYTSYASLDDLPRRATVFAKLKSKLDRHAAAFAEALAFDLGGRPLRLDSLWINVLKPGGSHSGHIHPNSVLSGTVYVATPPGASPLRFEDPRLPLMMAAPPRRADTPPAQSFVYYAPDPGTILMWESWLRHEAPANRARQDRISISFNYGWR